MSALLGLLLLAATPTPTPAPDAFDPAGLDVATLRTMAERGTVVLVDKDSTGALELVTAGIVIEAPPQTAFDVATDYEHYREFMPQVASATVVATKDATKDVELALQFKFSVITSSVKYVSRFTFEPPKRIRFEYVSGDLKSGGGSYVFVPLDGGTKTLLFYSTISDLRQMGFLTRTLLKEQPQMEPAIHVSTASIVATAIKARAESVAKKTTAAK